MSDPTQLKLLPVLPQGVQLPVPDIEVSADGVVQADVVIIGSGMSGSTTAWALRNSGLSVVVVERGDFLPRELENWSAEETFGAGRYKNAEQWIDSSNGAGFDPGVHYWVGGNTKVYGAMLPRFREEDFGEIAHRGGVSPAWPITYADIEPHYATAESLFGVHGEEGADPTDPPRSSPYPHPALEHEPFISDLAHSLSRQGLTPFSMPAAVDRGPSGRCVRCATCDGFPCMVDAKGDADVKALRPAIASGSVSLLTRTRIDRLVASADGKSVVEARGVRDGHEVVVRGQRFVLALGAVNTAALLLRSGDDQHPYGLGNSSELIGRNYMVHNSTFFVAVDPRRRNTTRFQKTLALNDWYTAGPGLEHPLGNIQMLGKLRAPMIAGARPWVPRSILRYMTDHSVDMYLTSEDLPDPANRISVGPDGRIHVAWTPNNLSAHDELVRRMRRVMRKAGFPLIFTERMGIATNSHMCGTALMGDDPRRSVVAPSGRVHDLLNTWVVDTSLFPSSAAVNPALTAAANALRIVETGGLADA